jgi:hypothetical protein
MSRLGLHFSIEHCTFASSHVVFQTQAAKPTIRNVYSRAVRIYRIRPQPHLSHGFFGSRIYLDMSDLLNTFGCETSSVQVMHAVIVH